jgi:hypothetical protein
VSGFWSTVIVLAVFTIAGALILAVAGYIVAGVAELHDDDELMYDPVRDAYDPAVKDVMRRHPSGGASS